jgi:hypothetical protein
LRVFHGSLLFINSTFAASEDATLGAGYKIGENGSLSGEFLRTQFFRRLGIVQTRTVNFSKRVTQGNHLLTGETGTLQAHNIQSTGARWIAIRRAVRRHILNDFGTAADDAARADAAELVHGTQSAENGVITNHDMTGKRPVV